VVALHPFQGELYAVTRNDETGFELWKTSGIGWTQITVPGLTDNSNFFVLRNEASYTYYYYYYNKSGSIQ